MSSLSFGQGATTGSAIAPLAIAALDTNHDGQPDMLFVGYDRTRDGVPDVLQGPGAIEASQIGYASVQGETRTPWLNSRPVPNGPTELLANPNFTLPSGTQSYMSPAYLNPDLGYGVPQRAVSPARIGPGRNAGRVAMTPNSGFADRADLTITIPSPTSRDGLDMSDRYSESIARRIHHVAERWRARFEDTKHQLDSIEIADNKRSWNSRMQIFQLEEQLKIVQAQESMWRARVETLERQYGVPVENTIAQLSRNDQPTELSAANFAANFANQEQITALKGELARLQALQNSRQWSDPQIIEQMTALQAEIARLQALQGFPRLSDPQAVDSLQLIEALQGEVESLRAAQRQWADLQASGAIDQFAALQAENARLRAIQESIDSQVNATISRGSQALNPRERRSLAISPEQRQEEVLARALELKQDLNEEGTDCTQEAHALALMMRVAALEQELVEEQAKSKQESAVLCAQMAALQAEVSETRAINASARRSVALQPGSQRSSIDQEDSLLLQGVALQPGSRRSSIEGQNARRSVMLQESMPQSMRRLSQKLEVAPIVAMEALTTDERQTLSNNEDERNQAILSRVSNLNEDLSEKRRSMHSNQAQQCQILVLRVAELEQELAEEQAKAKQASAVSNFQINELEQEVVIADSVNRRSIIDMQILQSNPENSKANAIRKSVVGLQNSQVEHLADELADAHSTSEKQNLVIADYRRRIAEVEQAHKEARESEADLLKLISDLRRRIAELERELADAHVAEANQVQKQNALNVRIVVLEQEVMGTKALEDKQTETNSNLRRRVEELEQELAGENMRSDKRIRVVTEQSARIAELERQLASGNERVAGFESKLAVARSRDME